MRSEIDEDNEDMEDAYQEDLMKKIGTNVKRLDEIKHYVSVDSSSDLSPTQSQYP